MVLIKVLGTFFGILCGKPRWSERSRIYAKVATRLIELSPWFNDAKVHYEHPVAADMDQLWRSWVIAEGERRTVAGIIRITASLVNICRSSAPIPVVSCRCPSSVKTWLLMHSIAKSRLRVGMPSDPALHDAPTAEAWAEVKGHTGCPEIRQVSCQILLACPFNLNCE